MWAILGLAFFVLLATGASLECEVCTAHGINCTGSMQTCPANEETCLITLTESTVDQKLVLTVKRSCGSTLRCNFPPVYFDLGHGRIYRSSWVCCTGQTCRQVTPQFPPLRTRAKALWNPAASSCSGTYRTGLANCTKLETDGFGMTSSTYANGILVDRRVKGCTMRFLCASRNSDSSEFTVGYDVVQKDDSTSERSKAESSQSFGLFLPSISGFLLQRIFL